MIENEQQLRRAVRDASALIQQISDYVQKDPDAADRARIRFPRGYIKKAANIRLNLRFIADANLRNNVSYALMTHEVFRWMVFSTDLSGQGRDMMIKEAICLLGNVCESMTIFPGEYGLGRKAGFAGRVARLSASGVIDEECWKLLDWLWQKRNQEHLIGVQFTEWNHYEIEDWFRSVKAYRSLRDSLLRWKGFEPQEVR